MKIEYSSHLQFRLKIRKISPELPKEILLKADNYYYDTLTALMIAVRKVEIEAGVDKTFMVAFIRVNDYIRLITIHPLKKHQQNNRENTKRWLKINPTI